MKTNVLNSKFSKAQGKISLCLCALMVSSMILGSYGTAMAQSNDVLNRIKRVENEIDTLNRAVYKGEKRPAVSQDSIDASVSMEQRLGLIESELRNLTGKLEQQSYDTQQLQQKLEALTQDSAVRLDALEKQSQSPRIPDNVGSDLKPMEDTNTIPPSSLIQPENDQIVPKSLQLNQDESSNSGVVTGQEIGGIDAASLYEKGFGEIKANDFDAAEKSFSAFVKDHPTHALAPNALYWLGETYYVRKSYDKAARTFAEAYQKYPNGPKGADNLLKLGMSLSAKGEKDNACIAFGQLKKEYPNGPEPVLKRGVEHMSSLGCS